MDDQQSADVVTINEAIEKVKKWAQEKDYEKVKEGSEEILTIEPDNEEIKALLETANKELGGETPATEPKPESEATPEVTPASEPEVAQEPEPAMEQMDVESTEKTNPEPAPESVEEPKTKGKSGNKNLILIVVLLLVLVGFVVSFFMGWLNPVFESALGLLGL